MKSKHFRVPNPLYYLNVRARWREFIARKALEHIRRVNDGLVSDVLAADYEEHHPLVPDLFPGYREDRPTSVSAGLLKGA